MTVQSVGSLTAGLRAVMNQAGPSAAATDSFSSVMSSKVSKNTETKTTDKQTVKKNNSDSDNSISNPNRSTATDDTQKVTDSAQTGPENKVTDRMEETGQPEDEPVTVEDMEEAFATLATALNQITQVFTENLEVSQEQLTAAASELGLEPADLLQGDGIKDLFLNLTGANPEELLTDENLLQNFNDISAQVDDILENADLDNLEMFTKLSDEESSAILNDPQFKEAFNEYLLGTNEEEPAEESLPKIEIRDLRTEKEPENMGRSETAGQTEETEEIKPAEQTEDDSKPETDARGRENFVEANDFIKNLAAAKENTEAGQVPQTNTFRDLYDITGQTISQMKVTLTSDESSMEIQLYPEHLGKVDVQINSKNGVMTAELTAHTEAAKHALEAGLEDLKVALQDTGLKVENVEVTLADYGFRQRDDSDNGEGRGEGHQGRRKRGLTETGNSIGSDFETASEIMKELNGNNVDYIA